MSTTVAYQRRTGSLTVIRWIFAVYFIGVGIAHFVVPAGLPPVMSWMYELSDGLHAVSGAAEILGGLGLVLPRLTGIAPRLLTTAAASGLAVVMLGAAVWHGGRGEWAQIVANLVVAAIMAFVAFREWRAA